MRPIGTEISCLILGPSNFCASDIECRSRQSLSDSDRLFAMTTSLTIPLAIAAGESGKEILYPVATVIIGGLITSTLLEFFVRPALFWTFGIGAAKNVCQAHADSVELVEETITPGSSDLQQG